MSKNHIENSDPSGKSTFGTGTRGESAGARNKSGNHHGNRTPTNRGLRVKPTRTPKSY